LKAIALLLLLVAYGLLVPGLNQPMLNVQGTVEKTKLVELGRDLLNDSKTTPGLMRNLTEMVIDTIDVSGTVNAFNKTQSIIGTAQELLSNDHVLVAVLIVLFSVVIPVGKGLMLAGNGLQENEGLVDFQANLEIGFWYFLGYCLVSILATQLLSHAYQREDTRLTNS